MKYTPLDIRHQEFAGAISGFSKREVKDFLSAVADDVEEYERQLRTQQEKNTALEAQVQELRRSASPTRFALTPSAKLN